MMPSNIEIAMGGSIYHLLDKLGVSLSDEILAAVSRLTSVEDAQQVMDAVSAFAAVVDRQLKRKEVI